MILSRLQVDFIVRAQDSSLLTKFEAGNTAFKPALCTSEFFLNRCAKQGVWTGRRQNPVTGNPAAIASALSGAVETPFSLS